MSIGETTPEIFGVAKAISKTTLVSAMVISEDSVLTTPVTLFGGRICNRYFPVGSWNAYLPLDDICRLYGVHSGYAPSTFNTFIHPPADLAISVIVPLRLPVDNVTFIVLESFAIVNSLLVVITYGDSI